MGHTHLHPTARALLETHDPTNWSMTKDGLICAPIGCYRILRHYEKGQVEGEGAISIAFAFDPSELDLVPHPENPDLKILKNPQYILRPIIEAPLFEAGCAESLMRQHQGAWLKFVLTKGNLYYSDLRNQTKGEYYSNTWISYGLFAQYNDIGQKVGYEVRFRANPFNTADAIGLNQDSYDTALAFLTERGVRLKSFGTHDEAVQFIHEDFNTRYDLFRVGSEIQNWGDPDLLRNVGMWWLNNISHLASEPSSTGTLLSKGLDLATKAKTIIPGVITETWMSSLEKHAEDEKHPTEFDSVAELDEENPPNAPLYLMKSEARENWVAYDRPLPPLMIRKLAICHDLVADRKGRVVDVVHNPSPAIVTCDHEAGDPHKAILSLTARTRHGVNVHHIGKDTRYITYTPAHVKEDMPIPEKYSSLFQEGTVACVKRCRVSDPLPEGTRTFHQMPHDRKHKLIYSFVPRDEALASLRKSPHIIDAINKHRMPSFGALDYASSIPSFPSDHVPTMRTRMKEAFRHYGAALLLTGPRRRDLCLAAASFSAAGFIATNQYPEILENARLLAYGLGAGFLARRFAKLATTLKERTVFSTYMHTFFAVAYLSYLIKSGIEMNDYVVTHGSKIPSLLGKEDMGENGLADAIALALTVQNVRSAFKCVRKAFSMTKNQLQPLILKDPQELQRGKHLRRPSSNSNKKKTSVVPDRLAA